MNQQPEALRLADALEDDLAGYDGLSLPRCCQDIADEAAAELRRLYWDELRVREHRDEMCAEVTRLHAQLAAANKACNEMALALERTGKERDYWHARLLAEVNRWNQMDPVAIVNGWHGGYPTIRVLDPATVLPDGLALFTR